MQIYISLSFFFWKVKKKNTQMESRESDDQDIDVLNKTRSDIGNEEVKDIVEIMKNSTNLKKLILKDNKITNDGAKYIGEALAENIPLEELDLSWNQISNEGIAAISTALITNTRLTSLDLHFNNIGTDGIFSIFFTLQKFNTTLKRLNVSDNNIKDKGAKHIISALKYNCTLKELLVDRNQITPEKMQEIKSLIAENADSSPGKPPSRIVHYKVLDLFRENQVEEAKVWLDKLDVTEVPKDGKKTYLHFLLESNQPSLELVSFLMQKKVDPNLQDATGKTCLHLAAINKNVGLDIIKYLVSYDASCNVIDSSNFLPLFYSCVRENPSFEIILYLFKKTESPLTEYSKGKTFFDLLKNNPYIFEGDYNKEGKQWNGSGMCFWRDLVAKEEWLFKGSLKMGKPVNGSVVMISDNKEKRLMKVRFENKRRVGVAVLMHNGKEYFTEFDKNGYEIPGKRDRTFEGIRLMIIGCENVGKTTFKKRLVGTSSKKDNFVANIDVQHEKREEEMTHGVEVTTWRDDQFGVFFSIWDFAGHEEYHISHSFFFQNSGIYLLLFDCSIELDQIVAKNKIL